MTQRFNKHGQPIGTDLPDWAGAKHPRQIGMCGQFTCLEALDPLTHVQDLFDAFSEDTTGAIWTYNVIGPFDTVGSLRRCIETARAVDAQPYFAVADLQSGKTVGIASFMRIQPDYGAFEIGGITFTPCL